MEVADDQGSRNASLRDGHIKEAGEFLPGLSNSLKEKIMYNRLVIAVVMGWVVLLGMGVDAALMVGLGHPVPSVSTPNMG